MAELTANPSSNGQSITRGSGPAPPTGFSNNQRLRVSILKEGRKVCATVRPRLRLRGLTTVCLRSYTGTYRDTMEMRLLVNAELSAWYAAGAAAGMIVPEWSSDPFVLNNTVCFNASGGVPPHGEPPYCLFSLTLGGDDACCPSLLTNTPPRACPTTTTTTTTTTTCTHASGNVSAPNSRWTYYALPEGTPPAEGWPVFIKFMPWNIAPPNNNQTCSSSSTGGGGGGPPALSPSCLAFFHHNCALPHNGASFSPCEQCVRALNATHSQEWDAAGCPERSSKYVFLSACGVAWGVASVCANPNSNPNHRHNPNP
jgi:hypothetical protein